MYGVSGFSYCVVGDSYPEFVEIPIVDPRPLVLGYPALLCTTFVEANIGVTHVHVFRGGPRGRGILVL